MKSASAVSAAANPMRMAAVSLATVFRELLRPRLRLPATLRPDRAVSADSLILRMAGFPVCDQPVEFVNVVRMLVAVADGEKQVNDALGFVAALRPGLDQRPAVVATPDEFDAVGQRRAAQLGFTRNLER